MYIVCFDLEGVFIPEIWINVAKKTGIDDLKLTTRDISDYDVLMKKRISILKENNLKLSDIKDVISTMEPLDGAYEFLQWIRENTQLIIVSDTFVQFASHFMKKLNWPTLFCNNLIIDSDGTIIDYKLRQNDGKKHTIIALKSINFDTIAVGDSYNDLSMIKKADHGILFCPPESIISENPQIPVSYNYNSLKTLILHILGENR